VTTRRGGGRRYARVRIAPEPAVGVVRTNPSFCRVSAAICRQVQRAGYPVRRETATEGQRPLSSW
jgi:hypothetical protein